MVKLHGILWKWIQTNNNIFSDASLLLGRPRSKVTISYCPFVVDVSPLSKIKSASLMCMDGITDVSALSKCNEVNLEGLDNISDVSAYWLYRIHTGS